MELIVVFVMQFSSVQLMDIFNVCFEVYLVFVIQLVEGFVQCFSVEGMSLVDFCVWLVGDELVVIVIVVCWGSVVCLVVFVLCLVWCGKGLGWKLMQELLMFL